MKRHYLLIGLLSLLLTSGLVLVGCDLDDNGTNNNGTIVVNTTSLTLTSDSPFYVALYMNNTKLDGPKTLTSNGDSCTFNQCQTGVALTVWGKYPRAGGIGTTTYHRLDVTLNEGETKT